MKKSVAILLAGAAMAAAAPAAAQSVDDSPFTGFRAQGVVGYDTTKAGSSVDDDANVDNDQSAEGVVYGAAVGYDIDLGGVVIGPEAEYTWSSASTEFENGDFEGFGFGNVSADRDLYVGARIGTRIGDEALAYVKGGYTNAKYNIRSSDGTTTFDEDYDVDGWRLGAGVEYAINQNMFVSGEYRYSNYSEAEVDFDGTLPDSERFNVDLDRHQLMVGLGVRF
ncbi:outer membrane beta-barrel protein [Parerythrobacter aurantius]|uniref:outer membrane protein n=1 Tax=Parerythrobacter aurantius TaxID=3127706 RepID=UPI0032555DBF